MMNQKITTIKPLNQNKMTEIVAIICGTVMFIAFMYFTNKSE